MLLGRLGGVDLKKQRHCEDRAVIDDCNDCILTTAYCLVGQ